MVSSVDESELASDVLPDYAIVWLPAVRQAQTGNQSRASRLPLALPCLAMHWIGCTCAETVKIARLTDAAYVTHEKLILQRADSQKWMCLRG
jgi:hypothetical protein